MTIDLAALAPGGLSSEDEALLPRSGYGHARCGQALMTPTTTNRAARSGAQDRQAMTNLPSELH
jgi:hypothetical protein